jgi:hypothetical protein
MACHDFAAAAAAANAVDAFDHRAVGEVRQGEARRGEVRRGERG